MNYIPHKLWVEYAAVLTAIAKRKGHPKWLKLISQSAEGEVPSWTVYGCCLCDYKDRVNINTILSYQHRMQQHGIKHLKEYGLMIFI
jgi:hypothetical protein